MRVWAALLIVVLGVSAALAQGDPRESYGPVSAVRSKAKADPKAASKPASKPEPKAARRSEPVKAAAAKKPKPEKPAAEKPVAAKGKPGPADKPATTGTAGTAAPKAPAAREAWMALPLSERIAVQSGLIWSGDLKAPSDGEFSDRLTEAAKDYQKRTKGKVTGVLTLEERTAIATAVTARQREMEWRVVEDPVTGARLGIPAKLATKVTPGPAGTRWATEQGQLQIETFRIDTGATLEAVFEQQKKMPRRRISYQNIQGGTFVIAGMQGLKKMRVTASIRDGEVRGLSILYDQALEGDIDPILSPLAWSFVPFTSGFALAAASTADAPRRKVEYGTGIFVSADGHVLTDRRLTDGCSVITLPGLGDAERVADDLGSNLALLRVNGASGTMPTLLRTSGTATDVTLVGVADPQAQGGAAAVSTVTSRADTPGPLGTRLLDTTPSLGFAGAAAFDADGNLAGMVQMPPVVTSSAAAVAPRASVVLAEAIRKFLEANKVPMDHPARIADAKAAVTRVICVRK